MLRDSLRTSWWGLILRDHDTEPTELAGGLFKLVIGFWLLLPFDTFASVGTPAHLMIAPEWVWGIVVLSLGLGHLLALRDGHRSWRRTTALVGFLVWVLFASNYAAQNLASLGAPVFTMFAAAQGWAYIRLGGPR